MKRKLTFGSIVRFIILAWLLIGLVYSLADYIPTWLAAETPLLSALLGIPMDIVGWPWAMWADYGSGELDLQFFATLAAILIALVLFLRILFRKPKTQTA